MSDVADRVLARLVPDFEQEADPGRAEGQQAYMRDQFPYLGLTLPQVRKLSKIVMTGLPRPGQDDLRAIVLRCWDLPEREFQYFACEILRGDALDPEFLPTLRTLITTKSWWDTVDPLATRVVGDLVRAHPALATTMDAWSADDNLWLARTAILHQLHWGTATDTRRLFSYCTAQAGHRDFFIRKAIGWALRHYARTDPSTVRAFVDAHRDVLSPLSVREATKHL
ncbi:DNA alkylation repair protein [Actinoplanes sp. NPDC051470]|uniref:DNA alkylation repair protein n=1 Tax=Actinoplanes sp. NPDC051470 TaxID=3157224 RepID=UPI00341FA669